VRRGDFPLIPQAAKLLNHDEAPRVAVNIAELPELLASLQPAPLY
jgi:hypothetical protein